MDPIPDVRASSAKALGNLVAGVGDADKAAAADEGGGDGLNSEFGELLPWMIKMLGTETSPVERSGAAQGLVSLYLYGSLSIHPKFTTVR